MQMMKNEKGITLVSLVVTVLVLGILAGMAIVSTTKTVKNVKDNNLTTELGLVRQAVTEQYGKAMAVGQTKTLPSEVQVSFWVGEKITDFYDINLPEQLSIITNDDVTEFYNMASNYSCQYQEDYYYRLTPENLEQLGLKDAESTFVVNYSTAEVYNETEQVNSLSELLYLPKTRYESVETNSQDFNDWE